MTVKVQTEKGTAQQFEMPEDISFISLSNTKLDTKFELVFDRELKGKIWKITEKGKSAHPPVSQNYIGLWITSKGYFISVVGINEAYIITEIGQKLAHCSINENGETELVGKLIERQRGEEQTTTSKGIKWPRLQA